MGETFGRNVGERTPIKDANKNILFFSFSPTLHTCIRALVPPSYTMQNFSISFHIIRVFLPCSNIEYLRQVVVGCPALRVNFFQTHSIARVKIFCVREAEKKPVKPNL